MKFSGFNIENTNLGHLDRISNLFGAMMVAFTWVYVVGLAQYEEVRAIRVFKERQNGEIVRKYGLGIITNYLFDTCFAPEFNIILKLTCT